MRFFFFGTLLDDEVLTLVVGRAVAAVDKRTAILPGFRRVKAAGVTYPVIVRQEDAAVAGLLVSGFSRLEAERLIAYEGSNYDLRAMTVVCDGCDREAQLFLPSMKGGLAPTSEEWTFEEWAGRHREAFVSSLRRWKSGGPMD